VGALNVVNVFLAKFAKVVRGQTDYILGNEYEGSTVGFGGERIECPQPGVLGIAGERRFPALGDSATFDRPFYQDRSTVISCCNIRNRASIPRELGFGEYHGLGTKLEDVITAGPLPGLPLGTHTFCSHLGNLADVCKCLQVRTHNT